MRCDDPGVCAGSELYFDTPSDTAKDMLYYVTSCGRFFTEYGYRIERENYYNYMLCYILDGRLSLSCDGVSYVADKGKIGFLDCTRPHEYHTIGNTEFLWVHLNGGNTAKFHAHIERLYGSFVFSHTRADEFQSMLAQLVRAYQTEQYLSEAEKSRQLYAMLLLLLEGKKNVETARVTSTLDESLRFIEENAGRSITLRDIADSVNISPYHFSRLFRKAYGYSPYEYLMLVRINRAKHLLKTTQEPVKAIAQQVGYTNASTFSSVFSEKVGLSPKAFREFPL